MILQKSIFETRYFFNTQRHLHSSLGMQFHRGLSARKNIYQSRKHLQWGDVFIYGPCKNV